eukprot:scaffold250427_cov54-Prasinocladus_malaysianus.AAC.1
MRYVDREVEIVHRPLANRNKVLHPAVVEYAPPQITAAGECSPNNAEPQPPLHLPPMPKVIIMALGALMSPNPDCLYALSASDN